MDLTEKIVEMRIILDKKWEFTDSLAESKLMSMKSTQTYQKNTTFKKIYIMKENKQLQEEAEFLMKKYHK